MVVVEKFSKTKLKNLIKKLGDQMDWQSEFINSITITTTDLFINEFDSHEKTEIESFEDTDVYYAYCFPMSSTVKIKIEARFGNGEGYLEEFVTQFYQDIKAIEEA